MRSKDLLPFDLLDCVNICCICATSVPESQTYKFHFMSSYDMRTLNDPINELNTSRSNQNGL